MEWHEEARRAVVIAALLWFDEDVLNEIRSF